MKIQRTGTAGIWQFNLHGNLKYIEKAALEHLCVIRNGTQKRKRARGVAYGAYDNVKKFKDYLLYGI